MGIITLETGCLIVNMEKANKHGLVSLHGQVTHIKEIWKMDSGMVMEFTDTLIMMNIMESGKKESEVVKEN